MAIISAQELLLLQLEAMKAVLGDDGEYSLRAICRWYSEKYHTPLHEVGSPTGTVPIEDVLRTFYEVRYHDLEPNKRDIEVELLLITDEDRRQEALRRDIEEYENWTFARIIEAQEIAKKTKEKKQEEAKRLEDSVPRPQVPISDTPETALPKNTTGTVLKPKPMRGPAMVSTPAVTKDRPRMVDTALPEDVKVVFMSDEEIEAEAATLDPFAVSKAPPQSRKQIPSKK